MYLATEMSVSEPDIKTITCDDLCHSYLHGGVVHDHALKGDFRITARNLFTAFQEEAITQLPAPTNTHTHTLGCIMCF